MATTITTHCKMGIVDASGNVNVLYPQTTGSDVSITPTSVVTATTVQGLVNSLKASAFISNFTGINDSSTTSTTATYSASKIAALNSDLSNKVNNLEATNNIHTVARISNHSPVSAIQSYICHKSGHLFVFSGYIQTSSSINSNTNFLHFDVTIPGDRLYIPILARSTAPFYCIMDHDGYIYCESSMPADIYIFTISTIIN